MKVFHKKKICEQLRDAIKLAADYNKEIDYIEITEEEWKRLKKEIGLATFMGSGSIKQFEGVNIKMAENISQNTCAAEIPVISDSDLRDAIRYCRTAPVGINFTDVMKLVRRLGGSMFSRAQFDVNPIPQDKRQEFLDEIDKLLLASIKREAA